MGSRQCDQIAATGADNGVDLVPVEDIARDKRRYIRLDTNLLRERRLEHAPVYRLFRRIRLTGGYVDQVASMRLEGPGELNRIFRRSSALDPVGCGDPDGHGPFFRPNGTASIEHFQRIAQTVFDRSAVFVTALVGERR